MAGRTRLGLIFGGRSVEHEVSVVSAQHVIAAADEGRFEVVPIGVTKAGQWLSPEETARQLATPEAAFRKQLRAVEGAPVIDLEALRTVDVAFPLIHGTHGEDGTLQGLLELLGLPYVGCGVGASAIGMDKALMKAAFRGNGLPVVDHVVLQAPSTSSGRAGDAKETLDLAREIEERIGYPAFVKPANGGSSVGISKVRGREELVTALGFAAQHDRKLVVEKSVTAREIECAILGNEDAQASPLGEIRHQRDFYDYEAKYLDARTEVLAPVELPSHVASKIQAMALACYHAIDCSGMSRVDFFLFDDGSIIIDEINTIPGFTPASMFPRLWQAAGVTYSELITRLVDFGLTRHREQRFA